MVGNKIADIITKVSITLPQNSSETDPNKAENISLDREIPRENYMSRIDTENYGSSYINLII